MSFAGSPTPRIAILEKPSQGEPICVQALEHGDEEREDWCSAAAAEVAHFSRIHAEYKGGRELEAHACMISIASAIILKRALQGKGAVVECLQKVGALGKRGEEVLAMSRQAVAMPWVGARTTRASG